MKRIMLGCFTLIALFFGYPFISEKTFKNHSIAVKSKDTINQRLQQQADSLKAFIKKTSGYNNDFVFLIDMKIKSGENRFFVYDLKENKIKDQGLVAHGSGSETGEENQLKFSNIPNSNTTSLGKYAIGNSYVGKFGKAYKLFGLDETNNKAFERFIVLHHYEKVPYDEQSNPICNSLGCPMVNEKFFNRLAEIIDGSDKPMLLYLYY